MRRGDRVEIDGLVHMVEFDDDETFCHRRAVGYVRIPGCITCLRCLVYSSGLALRPPIWFGP